MYIVCLLTFIKAFPLRVARISPNIFISVECQFGIWIEASWKYYCWKTDTNWKSTLRMLRPSSVEQSDRGEQSLDRWARASGSLPCVHGLSSQTETQPWIPRRKSGIISVPANSLNLTVHHLASELPSPLVIQDEASFLYLDIIDLK